MASPGPLLEAYIYKHTIVGDYVVRRYAQLYPNCFTTRRKEPSVDPEGDYTTYELDHTARLIPADVAAIEKKKRHIRPHGVGSMTALAAIRGKGQSVELVSICCRDVQLIQGASSQQQMGSITLQYSCQGSVMHAMNGKATAKIVPIALCMSLHNGKLAADKGMNRDTSMHNRCALRHFQLAL